METKLYEDLPAASVTPGPWDIGGNAYLILAKFPLEYIKSHGFFTPWHSKNLSDGLANVFLARFDQTNVGSYHELAISPARFLFNKRKLSSMTKIYVDKAVTAVSGRANWAIPKEMAEFEWNKSDKRTEEVIVKKQGRIIAEMIFRNYPFSIPFNTRYVGSGPRTNLQPSDDKIYLMDVLMKAHLKLARLMHCKFDPDYFCDLNQAKILGTFKILNFKAHYPLPEVFSK